MSENNEINQIISQAKSEVRSDNLKKLIAKNSKILVVIAGLVVVGAISFFIFNAYQKSQEAKFSEILQQSIVDQKSGDLEKTKETLKKIVETKSAPKNIKALATLRYAALLLDEGKNSEAVALYQEINQCKGCDAYIKDLGGLLVVKVWISDETEFQKDDLLARIEKIEVGSKDLKNQISEQKALVQMHKNNLDKAYLTFESLAKNPEAEEGLKKRAEEGMKIVISKGYSPNAPEALEVQSKSEESKK